MDQFFFYAGIFLCLVMLLSLYRAVAGPTILDRLVGVNAIGSKTTVLLVMIGLFYHRVDMFVDISTGYALLNLVGALAIAKYLEERGEVF